MTTKIKLLPKGRKFMSSSCEVQEDREAWFDTLQRKSSGAKFTPWCKTNACVRKTRPFKAYPLISKHYIALCFTNSVAPS